MTPLIWFVLIVASVAITMILVRRPEPQPVDLTIWPTRRHLVQGPDREPFVALWRRLK